MNWKDINLKAVLLIANNKVKKIMDSKNFGEQWEVGDEDKFYTVRLLTKSGSNSLLCSCKGGSLKPENICAHKVAVVMFAQKGLFK